MNYNPDPEPKEGSVPDPGPKGRSVRDLRERIRNSGIPWKGILVLALFIGVNYWIIDFYGSLALWGYVLIPLWGIIIYLFLDRESMTLIEVTLEGDVLDEEGNLRTQCTDTRIWKVPPQRWDELEIRGKVFSAGSRTYIADHFDQENGIVYFPEDEILSNISFYLRLDHWMDLKRRIPALSRELSRFRWNNQIISEENAVWMLEDLGILRDRLRDPRKVPGRRMRDPDGTPIIRTRGDHPGGK